MWLWVRDLQASVTCFGQSKSDESMSLLSLMIWFTQALLLMMTKFVRRDQILTLTLAVGELVSNERQLMVGCVCVIPFLFLFMFLHPSLGLVSCLLLLVCRYEIGCLVVSKSRDRAPSDISPPHFSTPHMYTHT